ncbi:hypothetical protein U9M48_001853 [Paspalum notatum var. saurae]|uniref:Uncharacterized protein n=1 Tax=Paspalum notatum var. saurae TaxID=547442 RepID=A0AAQ3PQ71_PASNO
MSLRFGGRALLQAPRGQPHRRRHRRLLPGGGHAARRRPRTSEGRTAKVVWGTSGGSGPGARAVVPGSARAGWRARHSGHAADGDHPHVAPRLTAVTPLATRRPHTIATAHTPPSHLAGAARAALRTLPPPRRAAPRIPDAPWPTPACTRIKPPAVPRAGVWAFLARCAVPDDGAWRVGFRVKDERDAASVVVGMDRLRWWSGGEGRGQGQRRAGLLRALYRRSASAAGHTAASDNSQQGCAHLSMKLDTWCGRGKQEPGGEPVMDMAHSLNFSSENLTSVRRPPPFLSASHEHSSGTRNTNRRALGRHPPPVHRVRVIVSSFFGHKFPSSVSLMATEFTEGPID